MKVIVRKCFALKNLSILQNLKRKWKNENILGRISKMFTYFLIHRIKRKFLL